MACDTKGQLNKYHKHMLLWQLNKFDFFSMYQQTPTHMGRSRVFFGESSWYLGVTESVRQFDNWNLIENYY